MLPNQQNNHFKDRGEQIRVMIKLLNSSNNNIPDVDMSSYDNTLTKLLDNHNGVIDQNFINNVVLWKVNRYAEVDHETQTLLQTVKNSPTRSNPNIRLTLHKLLKTKGIKLAMATTILRFIKPSLFQLIDQRVYRVMYGYELKIPYNNDAKIDLYFKYLDDLELLCKQYMVKWEEADRYFYKLDQILNKKYKIKGYGNNNNEA